MRADDDGKVNGTGARGRKKRVSFAEAIICNGADGSRITGIQHWLRQAITLANNSSGEREVSRNADRGQHVSLTNRKICVPCRVFNQRHRRSGSSVGDQSALDPGFHRGVSSEHDRAVIFLDDLLMKSPSLVFFFFSFSLANSDGKSRADMLASSF